MNIQKEQRTGITISLEKPGPSHSHFIHTVFHSVQYKRKIGRISVY
jgi:hypothetical protein